MGQRVILLKTIQVILRERRQDRHRQRKMKDGERLKERKEARQVRDDTERLSSKKDGERKRTQTDTIDRERD